MESVSPTLVTPLPVVTPETMNELPSVKSTFPERLTVVTWVCPLEHAPTVVFTNSTSKQSDSTTYQ